MAYFLDNYPVHEDSKNLVLTEEQEKYCRVVYKILENGDARFDGFWNPDVKYSNEYAILPLRSTGGRVEPLGKNTEFANVLGSTEDPKPFIKGHWIDYWKRITNYPSAFCCTDGKFYHDNDQIYGNIFYREDGGWEEKITSANCCGKICGGHVVLGRKPTTPLPCAEVYIIAICDKHNIGHSTPSNRWGDGFYMKLAKEVNAVALKSYLKKLKNYIEEFKDEIRIE